MKISILDGTVSVGFELGLLVWSFGVRGLDLLRRTGVGGFSAPRKSGIVNWSQSEECLRRREGEGEALLFERNRRLLEVFYRRYEAGHV